MSKAAITTIFLIIAFLLYGCNPVTATQLTVEIIDQDIIVLPGNLNIRVCSQMEIIPSELDVNIYVTEREEWSSLEGVPAYTHYFNDQFISIPGTISRPISEELWQASGDSCYTAYLENAFANTQDWIEQDICPFKAIVVVANYWMGSWNAAEIIECKISS